MKQAIPADRKLHPIEAAIVAHISRYGLTTAAASVAAGVRGMSDLRIAEYRLQALCGRGLTSRQALTVDTECYVLPTSVNSRTKQPSAAPAPQVLRRRYAMLQFCCGSVRRQKLTTNELGARFPDLVRFGSSHNYYFTHLESQPRLGFLRVDLDGPGRWDRIVAKTLGDIHWHFALPLIRTLLANDAFEITLLTTQPAKADRICERFRGKHLPAVPIHVQALPQTKDSQDDSRAQRAELARQESLLVAQQDRLLDMRLKDELDQDAYAAKQTQLRDRLAAIKLQRDAVDRSHDETADLASKVFELPQTLEHKWVTADCFE